MATGQVREEQAASHEPVPGRAGCPQPAAPRAPGTARPTRKGSFLGPVLGDLVICLDEARRQARVFGTTWQAEVVRYLVHGLLHLGGHDDLEASTRRRMKRVEDRIVRRLAAGFDFKRLGKGASVPA